jgi:excisionase family DNA binding protein
MGSAYLPSDAVGRAVDRNASTVNGARDRCEVRLQIRGRIRGRARSVTTETAAGLRLLAEALPPGAAVPVPREWLLELLGGVLQATSSSPQPDEELDDHLMTVAEVAVRLGVTKDWIYHHRKELPFAVKLGRRVLRFSAVKLERYLEARRRGSAA